MTETGAVSNRRSGTPLTSLVQHGIGVVLLLASPAVLSAQEPVPIGPEFQVNTYTTGDQEYPKIAADAAGNFVVVWQAYEQHGDRFGQVFGQRFDSAANPLGSEFQVNTDTPTSRLYFGLQSVGVAPAGNFVVVWEGEGVGYGDDLSSFGQRFDSAGNPQGGEFLVNTVTSGSQGNPEIAVDDEGNFVVAWVGRYYGSGTESDIFARRFDSTGMPRGNEFRVNTYTYEYQGYHGQVSVAGDPEGDFIVVWPGEGNEDYWGIFGRRYSSAGAPRGGQFLVNSYTTGEQDDPSVAVGGSGNVYVAGGTSNNAFEITPGGVITEIIDETGDGQGNPLTMATAIATDALGNVYVAGTFSSNAFKVLP